jgi:hypothetical protein
MKLIKCGGALFLTGFLIWLGGGLLTGPAAAQSSGDLPVYLPIMFTTGSPPGPVPGSTTGTLSAGGVLETPEGVALGALTDTLAAPISVTISGASAPAVSLPSAALGLGNFFEIHADQDVYPDTSSPLLAAFPVPGGVSTDNLALAVLQSGEGSQDVDPSVQDWILLEGLYDPAENKFLTTLASLNAAGRMFVLVEHPDFDSPANTRAPSGMAHPDAPLFSVNCVNFSDPAACTATTENQVSSFLGDIYDRLQTELGFAEPRLRNLAGSLNASSPSLNSLGYSAYIEPHDTGFCDSRQAGGYFDQREGRLVLCLNPNVGLDPDYVHILIHEYFHATQYGYPATFNDYLGRQDDAWVIEGMAKAAEESYFVNEMVRSEVGGWVQLHDVDQPMEVVDTLNEYFAQDFWVFHGQKNGQGLEYLQSYLAQGASTQMVATLLGDGQFMAGYWDWAKNQALEKTVNFNGKLGAACSLLAEVAPQKEIFNYVWGTHFYQEVMGVEPLSSVVVEVHFDHNYDGASGYAYAQNNDTIGAQALEYKFYKEGEGGCEGIPEGPRTYMNVTPSDRYYVLITNTDISSAHDYVVNFENWPIPTR